MRWIDSSSFGRRAFCSNCGSPLQVRVTHQPQTVDFPIVTLDEPNASAPEFHIFWASRVAWFDPDDGLPRHEVGRGSLLPQAKAQTLHVCDQAFIAPRLGIGEQIGESRPGQLLFCPALDRRKARRDFGLGRKGGEQSMRETVDGLDAEPAGGFEHRGKEPASSLKRLRIVPLTKPVQFLAQKRVGQAYPGRKPRADPVCHLCGTSLGESQAEDCLWPCSVQKKPEDPSRQDLRLSRSCGC